MAKQAVGTQGISIRLACDTFQVSQTCYRYDAKRNAENEEIARWLMRLTDNHRTRALVCATCICAMCEATAGATSVCTGFIANWS